MGHSAFPDSFRPFDVQTSAATIHGLIGGSGPPLLLLHSIPETHLMWRNVAPALAERFTVVATDLRGFGDSGAPSPDQEGIDYSMRGLAGDQAEAMTALGFDTFAVAGHDRGARCAYRLAIDHPARVRRLAALDIVPTGDAFERADAEFALGFWVWSFLGAPAPVPETLIQHAPEAFVGSMLNAWPDPAYRFPPEIRERYVRQFTEPERLRAICAQYREAAKTDRAMDLADRARRPISCPTLVLWSSAGPVGQWYQPLDVWRAWARDVEGHGLPGGHFCPEEVPQLVAQELARFFGAG